MKLSSVYVLFFLACIGLLIPSGVMAQEVFTDIEVGFQTVDVSGNEDMYRTQLNDDDGFVIRDFSLLLVDSENSSGLYDRFRIDASGFGASPAGRFYVTTELADRYKLRLRAQHYDMYSAYPGWANPMTGDAAIPAYHTADRSRHSFDLELELLPGRMITPIIGYRINELDGPGLTSYHVGQDEFLLNSATEETERELRLGVAFQKGTFRGAVIQGWREFEATTTSRLTSSTSGGFNSRPVLGTDVMLDDYSHTMRTKADTPVTTAYVSGTIADRVRLNASYVRANGDSESASSEMLTGSLVSFQISRFFQGLEESIESRTDNPSWRGSLRAEIDLCSHAVLDVGYSSHHRELEGWALVSSLYLDTLNFSGADPRDITGMVEVENGYTRDDDVIDIALRVSDIGPFSFWGGWTTTDTSLDLDQDIAQVVVPGNQAGAFDRSIDTIEFGTKIAVGPFRLIVDYTSDDADASILRTDYIDRTRLRGRLDWTPVEWLTLLGTAERIESDNMTPGSGFKADTDHYSVDLNLRPIDSLMLSFAWDNYETESTIGIRIPHNFATDVSFHLEEGEMFDSSIEWHVWLLSIVAGYSTFENQGSLPFQLDRSYGRVAIDFTKSWGAAIEFETHEYSESTFSAADFDADRIGVFVRWRS